MALKRMSRKTLGNKRSVEQYDSKAKKRANNPTDGLVDAKSDAVEGKKPKDKKGETLIEAYRGTDVPAVRTGKAWPRAGESRG